MRRRGAKCRCPMCGRKNANTNHVRSSYLRVGLGRDENGYNCSGLTKQETRGLRRTREKRQWKEH